MSEFAKEMIPANLEQEMRQSYLDYAMSVIVGRALPDVSDGLKPVHRRVLYAMSELNNDWNKPYKKSARIVGDVIGKYHPHGDTAVYDTIVRMAQSFSLRYPLIDGQGNFGSIDGDSPAAMRYTEIRLSRIAHELLSDIDKETVDFGLNYDESETQPLVLPTRVPNLLVNGSSGIAVGMATNIPPHNLTEVVAACLALLDDSSLEVADLMQHIKGPDFPTWGIINGSRGIREAYHTGRGRIHVRAKVEIETDEKTDRNQIIVHELPYQVNKARLMEKIAELVKNKRLEGISGLRDESDKSGMRMVIQLKRGELPDVVLNNLYQQTQLQTVFGINMVALENNQPRLFGLKDMLSAFLKHRREVVTRRTLFELRKARARAHILEGLAIALANIDPIIELIKRSPSPAEAKEQLVATQWPAGLVVEMLSRADDIESRPDDLEPGFGLDADLYRLSPIQAQAILDLRLHRLTGLEQEKILKEYSDILERIRDLIDILENPDRLREVIREELTEISDNYGDDRRTEIRETYEDLTDEDLIAREEMVVTISHLGYAKSQPLSEYRAQRRGGRGKMATQTRSEDFVERMIVANSHDTLLCFSNLGKVYWLKVYQIPQAGRSARGRPLVNMLPLAENEKISTTLALSEYPEGYHIVMATAGGTIKKSSLASYSRQRSNGLIAIDLKDGDELVGVELTQGVDDIMLFSSAGKAVRFNETGVREMGRVSQGVRGIRLGSDQHVISMVVLESGDAEGHVLIGTENGYGKRTPVVDFPLHNRGGQGVIAIQTSGRNGAVVGALKIGSEDEIMLISNAGTLIRTRVSEVSVLSRNTQGVRLINMSGDEKLISINRVDEGQSDDSAEDSNEDSDDTRVEGSNGNERIENDANSRTPDANADDDVSTDGSDSEDHDNDDTSNR
ncbi:MAG: DNA gyrase subunit A [marine bacterium B5-7]|nr:MAG: DNA gyrase subunit A [marine bacterium B5-7]